MKKKKVLSVLLAVAMAVMCFAGISVSASAYDEWEEYGDFTYYWYGGWSIDGVDEDHESCIMAYNGTSSKIEVPDIIDDDFDGSGDRALIVSIYSEAFKDCTSLEDISLPSTLTTIEEYAFSGCTSLTSVTLPSSLTELEDYAFSGCDNLTDIYFEGTDEEWYAITDGDEARLGAGYGGGGYFGYATLDELSEILFGTTEHTFTLHFEESGTSITHNSSSTTYSATSSPSDDDILQAYYDQMNVWYMAYCQYFFADLNADGVMELIVASRLNFDGGYYSLYVYVYYYNNGVIEEAGSLWEYMFCAAEPIDLTLKMYKDGDNYRAFLYADGAEYDYSAGYDESIQGFVAVDREVIYEVTFDGSTAVFEEADPTGLTDTNAEYEVMGSNIPDYSNDSGWGMPLYDVAPYTYSSLITTYTSFTYVGYGYAASISNYDYGSSDSANADTNGSTGSDSTASSDSSGDTSGDDGTASSSGTSSDTDSTSSDSESGTEGTSGTSSTTSTAGSSSSSGTTTTTTTTASSSSTSSSSASSISSTSGKSSTTVTTGDSTGMGFACVVLLASAAVFAAVRRKKTGE